MSRVTLRLPDDLHRKLQAESWRTGASLNQLIVSTLSEAVARDEAMDREQGHLAEQVKHIRSALGDLAVVLNTDSLPPHLHPEDDLPDPDVYRHSLPVLHPPLSATIIADREDRF